MSENLRMLGIVAVFLLAGSLIWFFLSGSDVEEATEGPVGGPEIERRAAEVPEFDFEAVARPRSSSARVVATPEDRTAAEDAVEEDEESLVEGKRVIRKSGPGKISGEVTLTTSGELPPDLIIALHSIPDEARYDGSIDTVIDTSEVSAEGKYSFEKLALGRYTLFANSIEYTGTSGTSLTKERPERELNLELYGAAFISGMVTDSGGDGIPEAHVYVAGYLSGGTDIKAGMERSRGSGVGVNDAGEFRIANLQIRVPALQYRLIATAPGYSSTVTDLIATNVSGVSIVLGAGGDVSGIVINTGTQEPVAEVDVIVQADYALASKEAKTDANGEFALLGLDSGEHSIGIVDDILVVTSDTTKVTVYEGQAVEDVLLEVQTGAVITGRMYDSDTDMGIADIEIFGAPQEIANATRKTVRTDSDGNYTLEGLHTGSYQVEYGTVTGYNSQRRFEDRKNVVTRPASTSPGIDFPLSGGLRISGIVVDGQGRPVEEATLSGYRENGGGQSDYQRTKADGRFVLSGYKPNTRIRISPTAMDLAADPLYIDLETESVTGLRVEMAADAKISGTIVGKNGRPKGGVGLYASSAENPYGRSDTAGGDGKFTLAGLTAGSYGLKPYMNNGMNSRDKALATVTVRAGEHKEDLRVIWDIEEGRFTIAGRVTDDRGDPVSGVRLYSWGRSGGQLNATSNADGDYEFTGVTEGSYQIQGQRQGYQNSNVSALAGSVDANMTMARAGSISGNVVEAGTNAAVQDFSILVVNGGQRYQPYMERERKSFHHEDGEFTIDGAYPGTVQLMFKSPGRADVTVPVDGVMSADVLSGVVVAMETGSSLSGRVRNSVGDAMAGAYVYLGEAPQYEWEREQGAHATTDGDGRFTMDSLPTGDVVISAWARGYLVSSVAARTGGAGTVVEIELGTGGTIEGYVTVDGQGRASVNMYGSTTVNDRQHGVQGRTDSNGFYSIAGLPEGTVQLNAGFNDGTQQRNLNTSVVVALGMVTDYDFNFVSANSSVEGYIMLAENQPSSGSAQLQVDTGAGTESRYMEVGSDGHYLFENVPAGRVTLRGHSANPRGSKLVSADLGENEALRLDVSLFGGVTVLVTVENAPAGQFTQVVALPANYPVPTTMSMEALQSMSQDSIQYVSDVGGGDLEFQFMEAGNYTVVAMSFESSQDGPNFDDGGITSTQLSVGGDADVSVSLSF